MNGEHETARALEAAIERTRGVRRARVETNARGIESVRILVIPELSTDDAVRDAVEVASSLSVAIDPGAIQVIRVDNGGDHRRRIVSLSTERATGRFRTKVMLELAGDVLVGESDAPEGSAFERRSTVNATLGGMKELLSFPVELQSVRILEDGDQRIALVTLTRGVDILTGSAAVDGDEHLALARATLDALNRFVTRPSVSAGERSSSLS